MLALGAAAAGGLLAGSRADRSPSIPFLPRPPALDGSMVGDVGFDPLGIATEANLARMREAEVRHGRLAMVGTWGWPIAEGGLALAQRFVPVRSVCTGSGCYVDRTEDGRQAALQLSDIGTLCLTYWGALFALATYGELRARQGCFFDPLRLYVDADQHERARLQLAEMKHGRLAMCAIATHWAMKLAATVGGSASLALAAGVPKGSFTFAHQLWGETCVYSLTGRAAQAVCYPQSTDEAFDAVLSWEILVRTLTGYFREPYF